jgi:hypothetical protein
MWSESLGGATLLFLGVVLEEDALVLSVALDDVAVEVTGGRALGLVVELAFAQRCTLW